MIRRNACAAKAIGVALVLIGSLLSAAISAQDPAAQDPAAQDPTTQDLSASTDPLALLRAQYGTEAFGPALDDLRRAIESDPSDLERLRALAIFLCNEKSDPEHGEVFAKLLVERAADRPDAYPPLFSVYLLRGQQEELEKLAEVAVARFPDDPVTLFNHAMTCQRAMRSSAALESLLRAVELRPTSALYRFAVGDVLEQTRRYAEADQAYRECLKIDPHHPGARAGLAQVLGFQGLDEEAEQAFRSALEENIAEAGYPFALFLLQRGRQQEALPFLRKCVEVFPDHRMAWNNLARCQKALGNDKASQRALRRYRELQEKQDREEDQRLENILRARDRERSVGPVSETDRSSNG